MTYAQVFSKAKATSLPLIGRMTVSLTSCLAFLRPRVACTPCLSLKGKTMETYINDSLAAEIIRPSSSPARAGFFFMEKKDKTLRPCIHYSGLNDRHYIVVKGSLQMDPSKVSAVTSWSVPDSRKQLQ